MDSGTLEGVEGMKSYKAQSAMRELERKAVMARQNIPYMVEVPLNRVARRELARREKKDALNKSKDGEP